MRENRGREESEEDRDGREQGSTNNYKSKNISSIKSVPVQELGQRNSAAKCVKLASRAPSLTVYGEVSPDADLGPVLHFPH